MSISILTGKFFINVIILFLNCIESMQELRDLTEQVTTPAKEQPTPPTVAAAVARTPGSVLTYRSFKSLCNRTMRSVSTGEFTRALSDLKDVGEVTSIRSGARSRPSVVFVKREPEIIDWDSFDLLSKEVYTAAYMKKLPGCVTGNMRSALVASGKSKESILTK